MTTRIRNTAIAFQFKSKYLALNIPERKIIIDEFINYLTLVDDSNSLAWFNSQKIIHDAPDDEFRKSELMSQGVWKAFYDYMLVSTPLRLGVEAFLFH